jgi:NADPH:quinone reductase-like Zn-dependent oxidoreductase
MFFVVSPRADALERLADVLANGDIDVAIAATYPLSDGRAAYASRGGTRSSGKTVLVVSQP